MSTIDMRAVEEILRAAGYGVTIMPTGDGIGTLYASTGADEDGDAVFVSGRSEVVAGLVYLDRDGSAWANHAELTVGTDNGELSAGPDDYTAHALDGPELIARTIEDYLRGCADCGKPPVPGPYTGATTYCRAHWGVADRAYHPTADPTLARCIDPDHGIGDHPCDEVLGAERAAQIRDLGYDPRPMYCDTTTETGSDCGAPAIGVLNAFGESLTVFVCDAHRNEMLAWVADNTSEGFSYRPLRP